MMKSSPEASGHTAATVKAGSIPVAATKSKRHEDNDNQAAHGRGAETPCRPREGTFRARRDGEPNRRGEDNQEETFKAD